MLTCVVASALADNNNALPSPRLPRDTFVNELLAKMTTEEKIGQLYLISVGPDNPKDTIRTMIQHCQVGGIFNTLPRPDIRVMQDQAMQLSRLKNSAVFRL